MRFPHASVAVLSVLWAFAGMAATTAKITAGKSKPATSVKSTAAKKAVSSSAGKSTAGARRAGPVAAKTASKSKKTPVANWRTRQQYPTPDRYKEIQQALVDKGYLKSEPTGVWDQTSVDAMERFQTDQKMAPTGKINAPSLIGLGLGAKSAGAPEAPPLTSGAVPGGAIPVVPAAPPASAPGATQ